MSLPVGEGDYHFISEMVGHGEATVCLIIKEVCEALVDFMRDPAVQKHFPKSVEEFEDAIVNMNTEWQFPYAFNAIDGSHLPIKCPPGGALAMKDY